MIYQIADDWIQTVKLLELNCWKLLRIMLQQMPIMFLTMEINLIISVLPIGLGIAGKICCQFATHLVMKLEQCTTYKDIIIVIYNPKIKRNKNFQNAEIKLVLNCLYLSFLGYPFKALIHVSGEAGKVFS